MKYFADSIIKPYVRDSKYRSFCEIGASLGENTRKLLEIDSAKVTVIDPGLDADIRAKTDYDKRVTLLQGLSLDILPNISEQFDCILIDGDHNWYTVYNELRLIHERNLLKPGGTIFLHDVCFPYGRRDIYYQPETIPEEFRQPYAMKGIIAGQSELSEDGGVNGERYNAIREGGPRNGVLTAIEDFLKDNGNEYKFCYIKDQFGLGLIYKRGAHTPLSFYKWFLIFNAPKLTARLYPVVRSLKQLFKRSPRPEAAESVTNVEKS